LEIVNQNSPIPYPLYAKRCPFFLAVFDHKGIITNQAICGETTGAAVELIPPEAENRFQVIL